MNADPLQILADDASTLTYRPQLNPITGGVTSTLLLGQMLYWWKRSKRQPFYKFSAPAPSHPAYHEGDSWQEELGFTRTELDTALKRIAVKIGTGDSKEEALKTAVVVYWTGFDRLTYYEINEPLLRRKLAAIYGDMRQPVPVAEPVPTPAPRNAGNPQYETRNAGNPQYLMQESSITYCRKPALHESETTQRLPTERESAPAAPAAPPPPRKQPAAPSKATRAPSVLASNIAGACGINWRICTQAKYDALIEVAGLLEADGVQPEQVSRFVHYWKTTDWRGKKGDTPELRELQDTWAKAFPASAPAVPKRERKQLSDEELRAQLFKKGAAAELVAS